MSAEASTDALAFEPVQFAHDHATVRAHLEEMRLVHPLEYGPEPLAADDVATAYRLNLDVVDEPRLCGRISALTARALTDETLDYAAAACDAKAFLPGADPLWRQAWLSVGHFKADRAEARTRHIARTLAA